MYTDTISDTKKSNIPFAIPIAPFAYSASVSTFIYSSIFICDQCN